MFDPIMYLPSDESPISAWAKPISAHVCTRGNVNVSTIHRLDLPHSRLRPRNEGTPRMRKKITPELVEAMLALKGEGLYQHEIANELGVSVNSVNRALLERGMGTGQGAHNNRK